MELFVDRLDGKAAFMHPDGSFRDILYWEGVKLNKSCVVVKVELGLLYDTNLGALDDFHEKRAMSSGGSIDLRWLPGTVETLSMKDLKLDGTVDVFDLPRGVESLELDTNRLHGTFAMEGLPVSIHWLNIARNRFDGSLKLSVALPELRLFIGHTNRFSGTLECSALPPKIHRLDLSNNGFIGPLSLHAAPSSLRHLNLSENNIEQDSIPVTQFMIDSGLFTLDRSKIRAFTAPDGTEHSSEELSWLQ